MSRSVLRMKNVSAKSCRENQNTHFVFSNFFFFQKSCRLWDNVEKYCTARQVTDDKIIRRMRFACLITKATDTLRICNTYSLFHGSSGYTNAHQYYVIRTLPDLFNVKYGGTYSNHATFTGYLQLHGCLIKRCNIHCTDFKNSIIQCSMKVQTFCFSQLFVIVMPCCAHWIPHLFTRYVVRSPSWV
jgi:hypothetical protein